MSVTQVSELESRFLATARTYVKQPLEVRDHVFLAKNGNAMGMVILSDNTSLRFRLNPHKGEFVDERTIGDGKAW